VDISWECTTNKKIVHYLMDINGNISYTSQRPETRCRGLEKNMASSGWDGRTSGNQTWLAGKKYFKWKFFLLGQTLK